MPPSSTCTTNSATVRNTYLPKAFCEGVSTTFESGSSLWLLSSCGFLLLRKEKPHTNKPMPKSKNTTDANDHI